MSLPFTVGIISLLWFGARWAHSGAGGERMFWKLSILAGGLFAMVVQAGGIPL